RISDSTTWERRCESAADRSDARPVGYPSSRLLSEPLACVAHVTVLSVPTFHNGNMTSLSELCPLPGSAASEIGRHQPFSLRDDVEIRPIRPSDAQALIEGFRRLSPETIRRRFFAPLRELNPEFARRLANVDFVDRAAFVATLPGSDQVVAVGRYDRVGPDTAEVAFVTLDQLQRRGIASRIF